MVYGTMRAQSTEHYACNCTRLRMPVLFIAYANDDVRSLCARNMQRIVIRRFYIVRAHCILPNILFNVKFNIATYVCVCARAPARPKTRLRAHTDSRACAYARRLQAYSTLTWHVCCGAPTSKSLFVSLTPPLPAPEPCVRTQYGANGAVVRVLIFAYRLYHLM